MENIEENGTYKANLHRVGSLINESIIVLSVYAKLKDWEKTKREITSKNLLMKRSSRTLAGIFLAIRQRFLVKHDDLPDPEALADVISKDLSLKAKAQILYPYICESDVLIKDAILELVTRKINEYDPHLTREEVIDFLNTKSASHPELLRWSEYLKINWAKHLFSFLRDFGFMEKAPSHNLIKPILRVESFTFFMLDLLNKKVSTTEILRSDIWSLYLMDQNDMEYALVEAQTRGWIHYIRAGDVIELTERYTLEEWVDECLG